MLRRHKQTLARSQQFIDKAEEIRENHPEMGCRKMALMLKEPGCGRDKTEGILLQSGFRVIYPPNYIKTTHSVRLHQFENLIEGLELTDINRVVQTDITYLWLKGRFYYLVFIIDVYSRLICGYHASDGLEAEANMQALQMMLRLRGKENVRKLIHHSDRGSQYHCRKYLSTLKEHGIKISMCNAGWENAYTERINRTLKHEYLRHWNIDSLSGLKKQLKRAVKLYNEERPHWELVKQMPPAKFETHVIKLPKSKRPKEVIYKPVE